MLENVVKFREIWQKCARQHRYRKTLKSINASGKYRNSACKLLEVKPCTFKFCKWHKHVHFLQMVSALSLFANGISAFTFSKWHKHKAQISYFPFSDISLLSTISNGFLRNIKYHCQHSAKLLHFNN